MSPPLNLQAKWVATAVGYHITKLSMSLLTLGWSHEFRRYNIGCNTNHILFFYLLSKNYFKKK